MVEKEPAYANTSRFLGGAASSDGHKRDPIQLGAHLLIFGGRSVYGSLTGTPIDSEDTLAFSVLENIRPVIETVPLEKAADGYARMMEGKARFRIVLVTKYGMAKAA